MTGPSPVGEQRECALPREVADDPWDVYAAHRATAPVARHRARQSWIVFGYDDGERVLTSAAFAASHPLRVSRVVFGSTILDSQGPAHDALRSRLRAALRRGVVERLVASLIEPVAARVVAAASRAREVDVLAEIADVVPLRVLCDVLGADARAAGWLGEQVAPLVRSIDRGAVEAETARAARAALLGFAADLMASPPGTDRVADVLAAAVADGVVTRDQAVDNLVMLLVAGSATTVAAIGNGVVALLATPDLRRGLASSDLDANAVTAEALRLRPPVRFVPRFALEDVELSGVAIRKHELVQVCIGSANRDDRVFAAADAFDARRPWSPRPLTFGHGLHGCLGAWLGESETAVVLRTLATALDGHDVVADVEWQRGWTFSRPATLRLRAATP